MRRNARHGDVVLLLAPAGVSTPSVTVSAAAAGADTVWKNAGTDEGLREPLESAALILVVALSV
jgi:hypothetical protein